MCGIKLNKNYRYNTVKTLTKYFLKSLYARAEIWLMFTSVLLVFAVFIINTARSVNRDLFVVSPNIYEGPIYISVIFVCIFSSYLQVLHISRDIDSRVYESYLYGPVDEISYIAGIFITYSLINLIAIVFLPFMWILIITLLMGLLPSAAAFAGLIYGYFLSNLILFITMCIAAAAKKSKLSILYLLIFHFICTGIVLADTVISRFLIPLRRSDVDMFSFFRRLFHTLFEISVYFSPYTQFFLFLQNFYHYLSMAVIFSVVVLASQVLFAWLSQYLFKGSIK